MAISEADGEIHKYFSDHRYKVKFSAKSRPVLSVFTQSALSWLQNVRKPYSSISCQADFSFSKLNLFFLFWFAFWGGAVEDKAPCLPFCKKALCCSDLLMPHDPVGTLNKVYDKADKCNDYQFKNYILFYLLLLHSQWPSSNIKMFMTQLFVLLSTKSVFQYQFCADDYIQMDPYRALWSIDSLAW